MSTVGSRIKELRESKALSQSDLAIYLGISQPLLSRFVPYSDVQILIFLGKMTTTATFVLLSDPRMRLLKIWTA